MENIHQHILLLGKIVHIGKTYKSYENVYLTNKFMCILDIKDNKILMLPMLTFKNKKERIKKLSYEINFWYSNVHGNNKDGYIKCNKLYTLTFEQFNKIEEIQIRHKINDQQFIELRNYFQFLHRKNTKKLKQIEIKFIEETNLNHTEKKLKNEYEG